MRWRSHPRSRSASHSCIRAKWSSLDAIDLGSHIRWLVKQRLCSKRRFQKVRTILLRPLAVLVGSAALVRDADVSLPFQSCGAARYTVNQSTLCCESMLAVFLHFHRGDAHGKAEAECKVQVSDVRYARPRRTGRVLPVHRWYYSDWIGSSSGSSDTGSREGIAPPPKLFVVIGYVLQRPHEPKPRSYRGRIVEHPSEKSHCG